MDCLKEHEGSARPLFPSQPGGSGSRAACLKPDLGQIHKDCRWQYTQLSYKSPYRDRPSTLALQPLEIDVWTAARVCTRAPRFALASRTRGLMNIKSVYRLLSTPLLSPRFNYGDAAPRPEGYLLFAAARERASPCTR